MINALLLALPALAVLAVLGCMVATVLMIP